MNNHQNSQNNHSTVIRGQELGQEALKDACNTSRSDMELFGDGQRGAANPNLKNKETDSLMGKTGAVDPEALQVSIKTNRPSFSKEDVSRWQGCAILTLLIVGLATQVFLGIYQHKAIHSTNREYCNSISANDHSHDAKKTAQTNNSPQIASNSVKLIEEPVENLIIEEFSKDG